MLPISLPLFLSKSFIFYPPSIPLFSPSPIVQNETLQKDAMALGEEKPSGIDSPASFDAERNGGAAAVELVCPPSTTDRKLMAKIDFHVIPFLCIMYLLAFLGMCKPPIVMHHTPDTMGQIASTSPTPTSTTSRSSSSSKRRSTTTPSSSSSSPTSCSRSPPTSSSSASSPTSG